MSNVKDESLQVLLEEAKTLVYKKRVNGLRRLVDTMLDIVPKNTPIPYDWDKMNYVQQFQYLWSKTAKTKRRKIMLAFHQNSTRKGMLPTKWTSKLGGEYI